MHRTEGANAILDSEEKRVYTGGPPPTAITAAWLNAVQEEICHVIEQSGIILKTQATDTRDQLWQALSNIGNPYDYVVVSNGTFNDAIERVAANQYKFKDIYESIYFRSAEYSMNYVLDSGDTWGYIETNNCKHLDFEMGAYINMGNERGYIEVNTDGCLLNNISIRGLGIVASAIARSFLLNANYVTFMNCDSQIRLSNTTFRVFEGSGTALNNQTCNLNSCKIIDCNSSSSLYGYNYFYQVNNSIIYDIESTGSSVYGFYQVLNINNCMLKKIDANSTIYGIQESENCNNIFMEDFDANSILGITNQAGGFPRLINCNNVKLYDFNATGANCQGFSFITNISNCNVEMVDAVGNSYIFYQCSNLSNCYCTDIDSSGGDSYAFYQSKNISSCYCEDIDSSTGNYHGYVECNQLSSCYATTCEDGFNTCYQIAGCEAGSNDNNGFMLCNRIVGSRATGNGNDGFEDCNVLSGTSATLNTGNGYDGCKNMTANRSSGNTAANYNNSFADFAATQACADTAAGGYNS